MKNKWLPFSKKEADILKNNPLTKIYLLTGIRKNEIFSLLNAEKIGDGWGIIGKGNKFRVIPYHSEIENCINWLKDNNYQKKCVKTIYNDFKFVCETMEIKNGHPHRARAFFATNLLNQGVDLATIQILMGHSSIQTTAKYILINSERLAAAISQHIDPNNFIDGMTSTEMEKEIVRMRRVIFHLKNELARKYGDDE